MKRYVAIDAWSRLPDGRLVLYRCFRVVPGDRYCVQSADFFESQNDSGRVQQSDSQFRQLLLEQAPDERSETFETLEEAISHHERYFEDFWD
ncbi:MAG: hypothetical protein GY722_06065 [bacterium]|nr:hypothetical protein [bacterium]